MISGEIPPVIADLPYLHTIKFANLPNLTGSIPLTIKKLVNLSSITLDYTNLSGPIPEILSQIKTLKRIELISSGFSGTIPSSLSLLPNLRELVLSQYAFFILYSLFYFILFISSLNVWPICMFESKFKKFYHKFLLTYNEYFIRLILLASFKHFWWKFFGQYGANKIKPRD